MLDERYRRPSAEVARLLKRVICALRCRCARAAGARKEVFFHSFQPLKRLVSPSAQAGLKAVPWPVVRYADWGTLRCARAKRNCQNRRKLPNDPNLKKCPAEGEFGVSAGMTHFSKIAVRKALREPGCPATLIRDVRDVATAAMGSEGPGENKESF
jgi:hypothetical protein